MAPILEVVPGMAYRCRADPDRTLTDESAGLLGLTGHTSDDLSGGGIRLGQLIHVEDRARVRAAISSSLAQHRFFQIVYRLVTKNGPVRWVLERGRGVFDGEGHAVATEGSFIDLRCLANTVADCQHSEDSYRSFLKAAPFGFYRSSLDGRFKEVNPALVAILGYDSAEEVLALDMAEELYLRPEDRERLLDQCRDEVVFEGVEAEWRRRDGTTLTVRLSGRPVRDARQRFDHFEVIVEDVTRQKHLEERLRQTEKMRAIGTLASGVAHDFNNILTIIAGNAELLGNADRDSDIHDEALAEVQDAVERASTLVRQLLAFGRRQLRVTEVVDLNEIVRRIADMLRRLIKENIEVRTDLSDSPCWVKVDKNQIEQVLINLALNARDAMAQGGRLTLRTRTATLQWSENPSPDPARARDHAILDVEDTGQGISRAEQRRIFELFYSTKPPGRGTGLGLAMAYGTIKQSGGWINVESESGRGSTFRIYLPQMGPPMGPPHGAESASRQTCPVSLPGGKTALVVEDESSIRSLMALWLRKEGHTVLEAANGREAVDRVADHPGPIDLLVTDVIMPKLSGPGLQAELRRDRPELRTLFITGYSREELIRFEFSEPGPALLEKPFTEGGFIAAVRDVLRAPAPT